MSVPTLRSLCMDALARSDTPSSALSPQLRDDLVKLRLLQLQVAQARRDRDREANAAAMSAPQARVRYGVALLMEHSWDTGVDRLAVATAAHSRSRRGQR